MAGTATPSRFAFLDHPGPIPFAHRGGSLEAPENTWGAFRHARDLGYRYLESDVHATSDGVAVLLHDATLDRVSDRAGSLASLPWREVSTIRLADGEPVPRLDDALAAWPDARWNLDAKHDAAVEPLIEAVRRAGAVHRVCVTAFSERRVSRARQQLGPDLCAALGPNTTTALRLASLLPSGLLPTRALGACLLPSTLLPGGLQRAGAPAPYGAAQVPLRYGGVPVADRRLVATAHRAGLAVHVWTVDDEPTMDRLLDMGVDGIMTDRPSVLRSVLERRGAWA